MSKQPRRPDPVPHPDVAAGGVRRTRYYMHAFIDSLRECGHEPAHVRQVLGELLSPPLPAGVAGDRSQVATKSRGEAEGGEKSNG